MLVTLLVTVSCVVFEPPSFIFPATWLGLCICAFSACRVGRWYLILNKLEIKMYQTVILCCFVKVETLFLNKGFWKQSAEDNNWTYKIK
jgi:hypothetical protein